ncbi:MAG: photosystem I reaction center subunit XI, partial [Cyanobacteria bacterium P01_H01_bin.26]
MATSFASATGTPEVGNVATPINSSAVARTYINNLPAYRAGLSP